VVERLPNWRIATLALWHLGGATGRIDTEDIAELCWKWAPERFGWKKHIYPDIRIAGDALADAKKAKNGHLTDGDEREGGWVLTPAGVESIRANQELLDRFEGPPGRSALRREQDTLIQSLLSSEAHRRWQAGEGLTRFDVIDAIDLTADAPNTAIEHKLATLTNAVTIAGDQKAEEFIEWLRSRLQQREP
jgi:hypothetical protein